MLYNTYKKLGCNKLSQYHKAMNCTSTNSTTSNLRNSSKKTLKTNNYKHIM